MTPSAPDKPGWLQRLAQYLCLAFPPLSLNAWPGKAMPRIILPEAVRRRIARRHNLMPAASPEHEDVLLHGPGSCMESAALAFYDSLSLKAQAHSLWRFDPACRREKFAAMLAASPLAGHLFLDSRPAALAICEPCCPQAKTASIHFICQPFQGMRPEPGADPGAWRSGESVRLLHGCRLFVKQAHKRWPMLTCAIPRPWHGARSLAEALGFTALARLPRAGIAHMPAYARLLDLVFYTHPGDPQ